MTDLIKREDVIDMIETCCAGLCGVFCDYDGAMKFQKLIENIPSVEQEPKTGQWVEENINEWSRKIFCSKCGCPPPLEYVSNGDGYSASGHGEIKKTKYCPDCGAKMESEE